MNKANTNSLSISLEGVGCKDLCQTCFHRKCMIMKNNKPRRGCEQDRRGACFTIDRENGRTKSLVCDRYHNDGAIYREGHAPLIKRPEIYPQLKGIDPRNYRAEAKKKK